MPDLRLRYDVDAMTPTGARQQVTVLWLCGAPGVGKSVTGWAPFDQLGAEGIGVGYVDIDQLGMLYPATELDPARHDLKSRALAAVLPNYAAAGARTVVVSGVVDPAGAEMATLFPDASLTFCLLDVDDETLHRRILERGWETEAADECVARAARLRDSPFIDGAVETMGCDVSQVVARVRGRAVALAGDAVSIRDRDSDPPAVTSTNLLLVCGARAVGKSTLAFSVARTRWSDGRLTGFVDLQQLAFVRRPGRGGHSNTPLGIANLAAVHRLFALHGASCSWSARTCAQQTSTRPSARAHP